MFAIALTSFTTFFATIGPIEAAVLFATLTPNVDMRERRSIAVRAVVIASVILVVSTLFGGPLLRQLGVGIPALQTAGGIILLLISIEMIFAKPTSAFKLTPSEGAEAQAKEDLAIFPLATPLLAGPGAMSAGILLAANAHGDATALAVTIAALGAVMAATLFLLLVAHRLSNFIGVTAQRVLMRVFGILLAAIASPEAASCRHRADSASDTAWRNSGPLLSAFLTAPRQDRAQLRSLRCVGEGRRHVLFA